MLELLISDIEEYTGETDHKAEYRLIVQKLGETRVREVLSDCKDVQKPRNRGSVFTHKAKEKAAQLGIDLGFRLATAVDR